MSEDVGQIDRAKVLGVARELFHRVSWTHKTHEKEREIWTGRAEKEKWLTIVLTAVTTAFAVLGAVTSDFGALVLTGIMAAISTGFVLYQASFSSARGEAEHRAAAKRLVSLRDRYLMLILKASCKTTTLPELQHQLEALQSETALVYESAPDTSARAYAKATVGLKENDEMTSSDAEIDAMLPQQLRSAKDKDASASDDHSD